MSNIFDVCSTLALGSGSSVKIPFIGSGNIWIENTYESGVLDLAQSVIFNAILQTAPGQLSILGYDSDLSGIFAPFAMLSSGEYCCLDFIADKKELMVNLNYLWQQIQAVQNVIQGRKRSLWEFRNSTGQPVEGYKLVVLSLDMGMIDNDLRSRIAMLMRSGPAYGVSFLIVSTTYMSVQTQSGKDIDIKVESLAPNITVLGVEDSNIKVAGSSSTVRWSPIPAEEIIFECENFSENVKHAQLPVVPFNQIHNVNNMWSESSVEGLTFTIGKYGINNVDITIGDEINQRHNAIITGAVGQGKSNLISVIIHSLCLRYSPRELRMYLLDFKEGVTFKAFSNIGQDEYLPHARALGLESDVDFGKAILDMLFQEYQSRMRILKENNMKSIREYRLAFPEIEMPRIVVVIDEFQMMFGDDMNEGQRIAETLEKSVRLFRAVGIHFILASQTLGGNMALSYKKDSIFAQVPIRIALKNSLIESQQTLSLNNSAAAFLRPREAIVNLDYGEVSQNRKTVIAFADESLLVGIRKKWWENTHAKYSAPYVFESLKRITISRGIQALVERRHSAKIPAALIGEKISVDGTPIFIPLPKEPGRNIAILGSPDSECNQAVGMVQSIAISLAVQHPKGDARFVFFDFTQDKQTFAEAYPDFSALMENVGYYIESLHGDKLDETLKVMKDETFVDESVYVFGLGLDKWQYEKDLYGNGSSLKDFVEIAPTKGAHFIGWWTKSSAFTSQTAGYGSSDAFNSKIFLRIDERTVQSLTSPFVKWSPQENRGLISDDVELAEETIFVPYAPTNQADNAKFKSTMWN